METLRKIRDVTLEYGVSVRTLRYYEEMGILSSIRPIDYAYRVYNEKEIKRLEHILLLRKLNISIKDIKTIFESNECDCLMNILNKKVTDIDQESASLAYLHRLINEFIQQIKSIALSEHCDIKLLLDKIQTLEKEINVDETKVTKEESSEEEAQALNTLPKRAGIYGIPDIRVLQIPACKMVSSGPGNFGEENIDGFDRWFSKIPQQDFSIPRDFLMFDKEVNAMIWWYVYEPEMDTENFEIVDYEGGLYISAVSKDNDDIDGNRVYEGMLHWISESERFELDERPHHYTMSHIITTKYLQEIMGYSQLEIFVPIRVK